MGRIGWALVSLACGGFVGLGFAYFEAKDTGKVHLALAFMIVSGVALAIMGWAHSAGVMKEPEPAPELSLGSAGPLIAAKSDKEQLSKSSTREAKSAAEQGDEADKA